MTKKSSCVVKRVLAEIYAEIRITVISFVVVANKDVENIAKSMITTTVCINFFISTSPDGTSYLYNAVSVRRCQ